ncbi:MAG: alpha/beta fold hydrolase [Longimicrobiales bacterium]
MNPHMHESGPRENATGGSVFFIHGFPFDGSMWEPQLAALPAGWRGLAPDLRGFGRSPIDGDGCTPSGKRMGAGIARPDEPVLSMTCLADDMAALIEREADGPAVVCGLSMGGYVAFELVRRRPELVRGLILADTRATADDDEGRENRMRVAQTVRAVGARPVAQAMIPDLLTERTREEKPEVVEKVRSMILGTPAETLVAALAGMAARHDRTADLATLPARTLVVVGEHDAITPPDTARAMTNAIPEAELVVIPDAGHLSNLENPAAFNAALNGFLGGI